MGKGENFDQSENAFEEPQFERKLVGGTFLDIVLFVVRQGLVRHLVSAVGLGQVGMLERGLVDDLFEAFDVGLFAFLEIQEEFCLGYFVLQVRKQLLQNTLIPLMTQMLLQQVEVIQLSRLNGISACELLL